MINYKIFQELDGFKTAYETGRSERVSGLTRSPFQVIKMCEYYSSSKYLGTYLGNRKQIGADNYLDIPFYNIVNYRVALAKTATDLDIKNIQVESDNPEHQVHSMLLNHEVYEWMKEADFSETLNKMGSTRPKYGGYLVKKSMVDGKLCIDVVDWTKVYTDVTDIMAGPIVELHNMSPVALQSKSDIWENIPDVMETYKKVKGKDRPTKIDVYEIIGEYSDQVYNNATEGEETTDDEYNFSLQKYFIADIGGKKFLLYSEKPTGELEDYYRYLSWEDQSLDLGRGVIEDSEEAQVWTNDSVINEKLAMDLGGKVGIKTTSKKISGSILEHDHGKVYELEMGADMNSFSLAPSTIGQYQNQIEKWKVQADNVTNSYDAATGQQPPSGTPYSQTALLNAVAMKPFDYKRQEWGIHLSEMFSDWVIPYVVKKIKKEHILASDFSDAELQKIDDAFTNENSNSDLVEQTLAHFKDPQNPLPTPESQAQLIQTYKNHLKGQGKKRYIEVPDDFFADVEAKITVITTGEQKDKAATLTSLNTMMQTVVQSFNPTTGKFGVLEDPVLRRIFDEAVELAGSGVSPVSLGLSGEKGQSGINPVLATPPPVSTPPLPAMSTPLK